MRLARSVQVAIGLTAAGGVAIVLSGSALAADGGLATTSQKLQNASAQTVSTTGSGSVVVVTQDNDSKTVAPSQAQSSGSAAKDTGGAKETSTQTDKKPANDSSKTTEAAGVLDTPVTTDFTPAVGLVAKTGDTPKALSEEAPAKEPAATEGAAVVATAIVHGGPAVGEAQVVRKTVLRIQPTITNRVTTLVADLAATVPSAHAPAKAPTPATSTGLLGHLKAQLAETMIPQPVLPSADLTGALMLAINLLALITLLANVFTFTYGLWLRRGGFATAARSDAPTAFLPYVATPYLLGYASLPLRTHSPLFNGGRNETKIVSYVPNAFRKEERL